MEIDPRKNGIHSLAEALRAFKKLHKDPNDIFALKDSILRTHHALETLFKHILYQINPVLLVGEKIKVKDVIEGYNKWFKGDVATPLDELWTVTLKDAIKRLREFNLLKGLDEREFEEFLKAIDELTQYRNRLQHLGLKADPDRIGRILGIVIPRAIEALEETYSYILQFGLPSKFGFLPSTTFPPKSAAIMEDLCKILPEARDIIELLRYNYDSLIREAIQFFKGRTFNNQTLKLKIVDHGKVGAPPYMPNLMAEGFLNFNLDAHDLIGLRPESEVSYKAEIRISQPNFKEDKGFPNHGIAEGSLEFEAYIKVDKAKGTLILPNAEEKIAVLRDLTAIIEAKLDYKAEALMTDWHYDCMKILQAKGKLNVNLTSVPKGYKSEEIKLVGRYQSNLNEKNAPFRLHAFLEPDGSLKKGPLHLEWIVNTKGDVEFICREEEMV